MDYSVGLVDDICFSPPLFLDIRLGTSMLPGPKKHIQSFNSLSCRLFYFFLFMLISVFNMLACVPLLFCQIVIPNRKFVKNICVSLLRLL